MMRNKSKKKSDVGRIRTYAPEGTRFLVLRDNHSATTPLVNSMKRTGTKQVLTLATNITADLPTLIAADPDSNTKI